MDVADRAASEPREHIALQTTQCPVAVACSPGSRVLGDPFPGDNLEAVGSLLAASQLLCLTVLPWVNSTGQELPGSVPALSGLFKPHIWIYAKGETLLFPVETIL
jgi:hypothetical protein